MTACKEYQARIVALFDNEAVDEDLRLTAAHLSDCPACRALYLDLVTLRRAEAAGPVPSLSAGTRRAVLDGIKADQATPAGSHAPDRSGMFRSGRVQRWAAVLVIGVLSVVSLGLNRQARDLRDRLGAAEQEVAAIHEQRQLAEAQERQQKALSALYFRMAELEERVKRGSPSQRTAFPTPPYDHPPRQDNL
jgi:anti-sigma factor RsiW